jgi:hypothetical protein
MNPASRNSYLHSAVAQTRVTAATKTRTIWSTSMTKKATVGAVRRILKKVVSLLSFLSGYSTENSSG